MKKLTALLVSLFMLGNTLTAAFPVSATSTSNEDPVQGTDNYTEGVYECFSYRLYPDHAEIIGCDTTAAQLMLPNKIGGAPVTTIGDNAFSECTALTAIAIPETVTDISSTAFEGTALKKIYWESDPYHAGVENSLPHTVQSFNYFLSYEDTAEYTNGFENSMAYRKYSDHIEIYQMDTSLTEIVIPKEIEGLPVTKASGFCDSYMVGGIPSNYALRSITIPETVTSIGLSRCRALTDIILDGENPAYTVSDGVLFSKDMTVLMQYPLGREDSSYTIPDSVTAINDSAFSGASLRSVTIPEGVTAIGDSAFYECEQLTSLTLPESLTELGTSAFARCYALTEIAIPEGITELPNCTFQFCDKLGTVTLPESLTQIGEMAFYWAGITAVTIPDAVTTIGNNVFTHCTALSSVHIPAGLTEIPRYTFSECVSLNEITVDEENPSFRTIDGVLFSKDGTQLLQYPLGSTRTAYTVPDTTVTIATHAFADCAAIESVYIPESVTAISTYAFHKCTALQKAVILADTDSIPEYTFYGCSALSEITLSDSIRKIGHRAFTECADNTFVYFTGSEEAWNSMDIDFQNEALTEASEVYFDYKPESDIGTGYEIVAHGDFTVKDYGNRMTIIAYSGTASELMIPNAISGVPVTEIDGAFKDCTALETIAIPDSVTSICGDAFAGSSLKNVYWESDRFLFADFNNQLDPDNPLITAQHFYNFYVNDLDGEYTAGLHNGMVYYKYDQYVVIAQCNYSAEELVIPAEIDGLPVTAISGSAFYDNSIVGARHPSNRALREITIPASVTEIGYLMGCNALERINIAEENTAYSVLDGNILMSRDGRALLHYPSCREGTSYTVPETVTVIGYAAFAGCDHLTEIILPEGLTAIQEDAFLSCTELTDITLPESLTRIEAAFSYCQKLRSLEFPENVTDLSDVGYFFCENLTTLIIPETVTAIEDHYIGFGDGAVTDIYFRGTQAQWEALADGRALFSGAQVHYEFEDFSLADLNGSKTIDATDAAILLLGAAKAGATGISGLTNEQEGFADINADGKFDASDAAMLLQYSVYAGSGGTASIEEYSKTVSQKMKQNPA